MGHFVLWDRSKPAVAVTCGYCGGTVHFAPAEAARRKYCSRACYAAYLRAAYAAPQEGQVGRNLPQGRMQYRSEESRARSLANIGGADPPRAWWQTRELSWYRCAQCGEDFPSRATLHPSYCSNACRLRATYARRYHAVPAQCEICGEPFLNDKYQPRRTCSRRCGARIRTKGQGTITER